MLGEKTMKIFIVFLLLIGFPVPVFSADALIPYKILEKSELVSIKLSIDIEVSLIKDRLPNENELGALSKCLVSKEDKHERSFITFYLPRMKVGAGAYATAHHNPEMKVNILKFMLLQYPEYEKYAQ